MVVEWTFNVKSLMVNLSLLQEIVIRVYLIVYSVKNFNKHRIFFNIKSLELQYNLYNIDLLDLKIFVYTNTKYLIKITEIFKQIEYSN
jgi:hypothetical protein